MEPERTNGERRRVVARRRRGWAAGVRGARVHWYMYNCGAAASLAPALSERMLSERNA